MHTYLSTRLKYGIIIVYAYMYVTTYVYNTVGVDVKNTFTPSYENDLTYDNKVHNVTDKIIIYTL